MTSQLKSFLQKISTDPKFADAYKANPDAVAKEFGLTDEERTALGDGDIEKLKTLLDDEPGDVYFVIFANEKTGASAPATPAPTTPAPEPESPPTQDEREPQTSS